MPISNPTDIPNCELYYNATTAMYSDAGITPCTSGVPVQQLSDLSGNARHLIQTDVTHQPDAYPLEGFLVMRKGAVTRPGLTTEYLDTATTGLSLNQLTFFAVHMLRGPTAFNILCDDENDGLRYDLTESANVENTDPRTKNLSDADLSLQMDFLSRRIEVFRWDGSTKKLRVVGPDNDTSSSESATGTLGWGGIFRYGDYYAGGGYGAPGLTYACGLYSRAITDGEVDDLVAWSQSEFFTDTVGTPSSGSNDAVVVCDGDSRTAGGGGGNNTWPGALDTLLGAGWNTFNQGIPGTTVGDTIIDRFRAIGTIAALFDATAAHNIYIFNSCVNDVNAGASGSQCYQRHKENMIFNRYYGYQGIIWTTPGQSPEASSVTTARTDCNTYMRADFTVPTANAYVFLANPGVTYADALVDVAAFPQAADPTDPTYFQDEGGTFIHFTTALNNLIAAAMYDAIQFLPTPPSGVAGTQYYRQLIAGGGF